MMGVPLQCSAILVREKVRQETVRIYHTLGLHLHLGLTFPLEKPIYITVIKDFFFKEIITYYYYYYYYNWPEVTIKTFVILQMISNHFCSFKVSINQKSFFYKIKKKKNQ